MRRGYLSEYFTAVGSKTLTRVDATKKSNQHEIGDGKRGEVLKRVLGNTPRTTPLGNRFAGRFIWLQDEQESITDDGHLSWYDTRRNIADRAPEWRLYYQSNDVTDCMSEGDRVFIARQNDDALLFIVVPFESTIHRYVAWLFGVSPSDDGSFDAQPVTGETDPRLDFISRLILDEIGIEFEDPGSNSLENAIKKFGLKFPPTIEFSHWARLTSKGVDARGDPDAALYAWLNHEEEMFRCLERKIVSERLREGFEKNNEVDVEAFLKYSLHVHNRRKSRMGRSFEHHLSAIFEANDIRFDSQVVTELGKRPDFIFPSQVAYEDPEFDVELLTMLAAKSTCKDRWPQVLPEAKRITQKHLVTLELGISEAQTDQMSASKVQLIVPKVIHASYSERQKGWLWSVSDFVAFLAERQSR